MRLDGPAEIQAMRKKLIGYYNLICKCPQAQIDGYSFISKPRKSAKGGGVGAYISSSVPYHRRLDLELDDIECLWIEVLFPKSKGFLIGFIYRPPDSSKHLSKNFTCKLESTYRTSLWRTKNAF